MRSFFKAICLAPSSAAASDLVGQWTTGLVAAGESGGGRVIYWDTSSVVAQQGDNVTVLCTVRAVNFFDVVRLTLTPQSYNLHSPPGHSSDLAQQRWTIADNDAMKPPFSALDRYDVAIRIDGRRVVLSLQLAGIQGEDSGLFGCTRVSSSTEGNEEASLHVQVLVPVKEVYIASISPRGGESRVADGARVTLTQLRNDGVACIAVVDGSRVAPQVEVIVGDVDETDAFNYTATSTPLPLPPPTRRRLATSAVAGGGPTVHYRSIARLAYITDDPKSDFNGQTMRCIAVQSGFAKVLATATLVVRYAPIINCSESRRTRATPGRTTTFTCNIRANPSCDDVTWTYADGDDTGHDLHTDPNIRVSYRMLATTDRSETSMTIKHVEAQHFRSYTLTATNDVGRRRAILELVRGGQAEREGHDTWRPFPNKRLSDSGRVSRPTPRPDAANAQSRPVSTGVRRSAFSCVLLITECQLLLLLRAI